jgi:hypothetical protein
MEIIISFSLQSLTYAHSSLWHEAFTVPTIKNNLLEQIVVIIHILKLLFSSPCWLIYWLRYAMHRFYGWIIDHVLFCEEKGVSLERFVHRVNKIIKSNEIIVWSSQISFYDVNTFIGKVCQSRILGIIDCIIPRWV